MAWPFDDSEFSASLSQSMDDYYTQPMNASTTGTSLANMPTFSSGLTGETPDGINWLGSIDKNGMSTPGVLNTGLNALQAISGAWLGSKQLSLAQDQFAEAKKQFSKNFGSQVKSYNTDISDRQDRRYSGAGGNVSSNVYAPTSEYMSENKLES